MIEYNNKFEEDFTAAMNLLHIEKNLATFEKMTELYLATNPKYSPSIFIDFQLQVYNIFKEYTGVIMHYLKTPGETNYTGQHKEQFRRMQNLKRIVINHLINMESSISTPNRIKGNLFSYSDVYPYDISGAIIRGDGEYFKFSFDFNDGLNLSKAIIENLNEKFSRGQNNINRNEYDLLVEAFESLRQQMEELFKNEDEVLTQTEEGN